MQKKTILAKSVNTYSFESGLILIEESKLDKKSTVLSGESL